MKSVLALTVLAFIAAFSPCGAAARWRKADDTPGFRGWREQLQHMADKDGRARTNHFCVVTASYPASPRREAVIWAYVHWRETHELYTFDRSVDRMTDEAIFKLPLNLETDVSRHPGSSTYLVTPEWVHGILSHCAAEGDEVVVRTSHD